MTPEERLSSVKAVQKIDVDDRIPLLHYYRTANKLLTQARAFREKNNILDSYIILLKFSSLVCETMPFHRDYKDWSSEKKSILKKKLLNALDELESLKPEVQRLISEMNRGRTQTQPHQPEASSSAVGNIASLRLVIGQARHSTIPFNIRAQATPTTAQPIAEDREMATAFNASIQSAVAERPVLDTNQMYGEYASSSWSYSVNISSSSGGGSLKAPFHPKGSSMVCKVQEAGPGCNTTPNIPIKTRVEERKEDVCTSSCVICFDAPIQGACVPCGHMAGCMACLNEIKAKNRHCPVCRAKVDQVIRLYAV